MPLKITLGGLLTVRELYALGKNGCCFSMLSGSSAATAALAFKELSRIGENSLGYHVYPNLNSSVYREYQIPRNIYMKMCRILCLCMDSILMRNIWIICSFTVGGILRIMIAWLNSPEYPSDETKKFVQL